MSFDKNNKVYNFAEKPHLKTGWINGGFFVFDSKIFDFIKRKDCYIDMTGLTFKEYLNGKKNLIQ